MASRPLGPPSKSGGTARPRCRRRAPSCRARREGDGAASGPPAAAALARKRESSLRGVVDCGVVDSCASVVLGVEVTALG
eukprot:6172233-Prymnesium_polylepis.1